MVKSAIGHKPQQVQASNFKRRFAILNPNHLPFGRDGSGSEEQL